MLLFQSEFQARKTERGSLPLHQEPVVLRLQVSERSSLGPTVPGQEARISVCREVMRFWRLRLVPAPPQIQSLHVPADPGTYSILSFGAVHSRQVPTPVCRRVCAAARLAQSVEHETLNLRVVGSSPTLGVVFAAYLDSWLTWVGLLLPAVNFRFTTALLEAEGADIQIPAHLRKPA